MILCHPLGHLWSAAARRRLAVAFVFVGAGPGRPVASFGVGF